MGLFSRKPKRLGSAMILYIPDLAHGQWDDESIRGGGMMASNEPSPELPTRTRVTHEGGFREGLWLATQDDAEIWVVSVLDRLGAIDRKVIARERDMTIIDFRLPSDP
jgi:hypothetical protein